MKIDIKNMTLDQFRRYKQIILPDWVDAIINVNTYYRILRNDFKFWPHNSTIKKLAEWLSITENQLITLIENQYKQDWIKSWK